MRELTSLSDAEIDLFRSEVASKIYIELNRYPHTFSELEEATGCSSKSVRKNLLRGENIGVWTRDTRHYVLTDQGKDLPDAVGKLGKIQEEEELKVGEKHYSHMNQASGLSAVFEETQDGSDRIITLQSSDKSDSNSYKGQTGSSADWIGSYFG